MCMCVCVHLVDLLVSDDVFGSLQHGLDWLLHGVSGREAADESIGGMLQ